MPHSSFVAVFSDTMEILPWGTGKKHGQICPRDKTLYLESAGAEGSLRS